MVIPIYDEEVGAESVTCHAYLTTESHFNTSSTIWKSDIKIGLGTVGLMQPHTHR